MAYVEGQSARSAYAVSDALDELIPEDHVYRVIEAFVNRLDMGGLGFVRAEPAETGRPGYDPRDLLKLYLYGYCSRSVHRVGTVPAECRSDSGCWGVWRLITRASLSSGGAPRGGDGGRRRSWHGLKATMQLILVLHSR